MKYSWLNRKQNDKLIIFFNGWGMDEKSVSRLDCGDFDVISFHDYRNLEAEWPELGTYKSKFLAAWSMGVFVASLFRERLEDTCVKIALNGTQKPVDDEFGIPSAVYDLTVKNFNELSCKKFVKRMFAGDVLPVLSGRTPEELRQELISIRDYSGAGYLPFDKVFISGSDKIVPPKNQLGFWQASGCVSIKNLQGGHYPFVNFKKWNDILNG